MCRPVRRVEHVEWSRALGDDPGLLVIQDRYLPGVTPFNHDLARERHGLRPSLAEPG